MQIFPPPSQWTTPSKAKFYALLNLAWFGLIPGIVEYFAFCLDRGDYSPSHDTIMIPIMGNVFSITASAPVLNVLAFVLLNFSELPAPLVVQPVRQLLDVVCIALCVAFTGFCTYALFNVLLNEPPAGILFLPPVAIFVYLTWSLRAGLLMRSTSKT